jgi:putative transposase
MKFNKQAHAVWKCDYHMVLVTKYRRKCINAGIFAYLELKLVEITKYYPEIEIKEVNHDEDHIHLLVSIPPKMSVSSVVRLIKTNTSRALRQKFPIFKEIYWKPDSCWSDGYFVTTVGINEAVIKQYIQNQGNEDSGQAKLELG